MMPHPFNDCKDEVKHPEGTRQLRNGQRPLPAVMVNPFCSELGAERVCCLPSETVQLPKLQHPCAVCGINPASLVEIPCGHVNCCVSCYGCYRHNERCMRCKQKTQGRVDVLPFLDINTGAPRACNMCMETDACIVAVPCGHMCFCQRCLPGNVAGCPHCGQRVQRVYTVQWQQNAAMPNMGGLEHATEDIDVEIERLERQLKQLKRLSHEDDDHRRSNGRGAASSRPVHTNGSEAGKDGYDRQSSSQSVHQWTQPSRHRQGAEEDHDEPGCW